MNKFSLVSLLCFVGVGACAVACSSDDDTVVTPNGGAGGRSGAPGGGASGKGGGGAGGSFSGGGGSLDLAGSGGEGGAIESTLYYRLGERTGIRADLVRIVNEELKDPIIATYFSQQASSAHKPTRTDIIECFTNLLASSAGGPEEYPFTTPSGYECRDMKAAHATLGIGAATFDKFVAIAAATLTELGTISDDDIATIGSVLNGTKSKVVDPNVPSGVRPCSSPASCAVPVVGDAGAGGAGGAGAEGGEGGASEGGTAGATTL